MAPVNRNHQKVSARREYFRQYQEKRKERAWPKCPACGLIARKLPDVGCLECHARTLGRDREWSRAESDMLEQHSGRDGIQYLQFRIYQETGQARSRSAIQCQNKTLGIKVYSHQDGLTVNDLMSLTGKPEMTIRHRIKGMGIKSLAKGRIVLISHEDGQRLIEYYKTTDKPSYSVEEAASVLGYYEPAIYKATKKGLPSWKEGRFLRVCKASVDRAAQYLRETGHTQLRISWGRLIVS